MIKARVIDGVVIDVSTDPENHYHPLIAAEFVEVPDEVEIGWLLDPETGAWSAPQAVPAVPTVQRPKLIITETTADADHAAQTQIKAGEITCLAGAVITFKTELHSADGAILPLTDTFRMPMRSSDGREKILLVQMVDGIATITAPMRESGTWSATETTINEALPESSQMEFAGVKVFVCEA